MKVEIAVLAQSIERMRGLMNRIDWNDLRDVCTDAPVLYTLQAFGILLAGSIMSRYTPRPFDWFALTYAIWMTLSLVGGLALNARWWLTWLVGTLLWSLGLLALCVWQLMALVER